jgi:hypothetical protein
MTLFEYLTVAFSLVYSLAALRLIGGISVAIAPTRRYRTHLLMTFALLLMIAGGFWTFWSLRDVTWTFVGFLVSLSVVGLIYYLAAVLIPENPGHVTSWRDHYSAVRRRWYVGWGLWAVVIALNATVNLGFPLAHPSRAIQAASLIIGIVGASSSSDRVHEVLALVLLVGMVGMMLTIGLSPSWLVQL